MKTVNLIRDFISSGDLKKAIISLVEKFQEDDLQNSVLSLSSRYNLLEEKKINGIISHQDMTVEENKIVYSTLKLLNKIEESHKEITLNNTNQKLDDRSIIEKLLKILDETYLGFNAQAKLRDKLHKDIKRRINVEEDIQFEEFFHKYYSKMNQEELEYHISIRDYTENILNQYNKKALELILGNETLIEKFPILQELERHLLVWLGKFERLFKNTPSLSLIYVGVDEENPLPRKKVEFPKGIEEALKTYLESEK